ncbi:MAG: glycosyltransferase family 2 protein [Cryomorphaceae bacterium]
MISGKTIAVVVPAYNEESQIEHVVQSMPDFVDRIVVVNDKSKDATLEVLQGLLEKSAADRPLEMPVPRNEKQIGKFDYDRADRVLQEILDKQSHDHTKREVLQDPNKRLVIINHLDNGGVGAAIASGYIWARDHKIDCTAVMAGDGQMDPAELEGICLPVIDEDIDYVKGNRLKHPAALQIVPKTRMFGNSVLSILTKIASGYWKVSDTQTGYTATSLRALEAIKLNDIYPRYGMPNDMLVKLNIQNCSVKEIVIKPIYNVGEQSKMKVGQVIPKISGILLRGFWKRIWIKYFIREFHPLFLLYGVGVLSLLVSSVYLIKISYLWITMLRPINELTILAFLFTFLFGFQSLLFAMWMDIQDNDKLHV